MSLSQIASPEVATQHIHNPRIYRQQTGYPSGKNKNVSKQLDNKYKLSQQLDSTLSKQFKQLDRLHK